MEEYILTECIDFPGLSELKVLSVLGTILDLYQHLVRQAVERGGHELKNVSGRNTQIYLTPTKHSEMWCPSIDPPSTLECQKKGGWGGAEIHQVGSRGKNYVNDAGFEPTTFGFGIQCSTN